MPFQGTSDGNRVGDRIHLERILYNFHHTYDSTLGDSYFIRITAIQWHPQATATPAPFNSNDIWLAGGATSYISAWNWDKIKSGQFTVLHDERHLMGDQALTKQQVARTIVLRKMRKTVQFYAGSGINASNLVYFIISTNTVTGTVGYQDQFRIVFTDS